MFHCFPGIKVAVNTENKLVSVLAISQILVFNVCIGIVTSSNPYHTHTRQVWWWQHHAVGMFFTVGARESGQN